MKRRFSLLATAAGMVVALAIAPTAAAHNRGLVWLPTGECVQVGSLKSVTLPDGTLLDLRPETPQDEFGAAYAADEGNSAIEKGQCPE
jgi:hypothetical protein